MEKAINKKFDSLTYRPSDKMLLFIEIAIEKFTFYTYVYIYMSYLKWTYCCSGIDYRVASLFTRYLTAKGIGPKNLKSIGHL